MTETVYHIAQANIGKLIAPIDDPKIHGFASRLDEINKLADETEGFVWRLQSDGGNATDFRPYEGDDILVNMSVWTDIDALFQYSYYSAHAEVFRDRKKWFVAGESESVIWWVPEGHIPSFEEMKEKIALLREHGPTPLAFNFKTRFTVEQMLEKLEA